VHVDAAPWPFAFMLGRSHWLSKKNNRKTEE